MMIVAFIRSDTLSYIIDGEKTKLEKAFIFIRQKLVSIVERISVVEHWYETDEAATDALKRMANSVYNDLYSIIRKMNDPMEPFQLIPEGAVPIKFLLSTLSGALMIVLRHIFPDEVEKICKLKINVKDYFAPFLMYRFKFIVVTDIAQQSKDITKYQFEKELFDLSFDYDPPNFNKDNLRCSIKVNSVNAYLTEINEIHETINVLIIDNFTSKQKPYGDKSMNCARDYLALVRYHLRKTYNEVDELMKHTTNNHCPGQRIHAGNYYDYSRHTLSKCHPKYMFVGKFPLKSLKSYLLGLFGIKFGALDLSMEWSGQIELSIDGDVVYKTKERKNVNGWVPIEETYHAFVDPNSKIKLYFDNRSLDPFTRGFWLGNTYTYEGSINTFGNCKGINFGDYAILSYSSYLVAPWRLV